MWQGWIHLVLGIWLIISGLISGLQAPINMIIVGILAIIFGAWAFKSWQSIVNGILGIWILLSGIVFNFVIPVNFIVVGIIMGLLGIWATQAKGVQVSTEAQVEQQ